MAAARAWKSGQLEHLLQQRLVDHVVVLVDPEGFEQVVLVVRVVLVERRDPLLGRRDDLVSWSRPPSSILAR